MGSIIPVGSRKRQEIEDLANSMLEIFAAEYRTVYGFEVLTSYEKSDEQKFPFSLKFPPWERINYPIKKGYLTKQGVIRKSWKRRYFVVQPNYLVDYYENEETYEKGLKPKGTINPSGYRTVSNLKDELARRQKDLAFMLGVDQQDSLEKFPNHTFGVVHDTSRSYYIRAESEEEKMEWVQMFQLCCACVKGFSTSGPICQATFNRAISKTLITYGNPEHHSYKGPEEKVICDMVTTEIDRRFMAEICDNGKGNFAAKMKIREQVLKDVDASVLNLVTPLLRTLKEDNDKIQLEVEKLIREKDREIAAVRRKVEWKMNGKTEAFLKAVLADVRSYSQRVFPILEKSMFDALCEVRNIYQKSVVEIGIDVEQREEVEIPIQMYIDSLDMLARTPSEIQTAYKLLDSVEKELTTAQHDLKTFDVTTIMLLAQERLRHVMDALVVTFQERFLEASCGIEGNQKHKQLRSLIEEVDDEVANNFENDLKEVIYSFNMKTLKMLFIPYVHKHIDTNCIEMVESAEVSVIPDHLTVVINRRNEYRRLVEKSVEELLKQVMNTNDEAKQRSFRSSLRNSRRKTFPTFSSRLTKFQDISNDRKRRTSLNPTKTNGVIKGHERKASLTNFFACLPIQTDFRDSGVYDVMEDPHSSEDNMQEIKLTLTRGTFPSFGSKT